VKAGGTQSKKLVEISDYVGNGREIEGSKSVPVGSPVGQNEPPVPISSHTQPSEPKADNNRITCLALVRAVCAGLGERQGRNGKAVAGREPRSVGETSCAWVR
jgi:hypothetical protein